MYSITVPRKRNNMWMKVLKSRKARGTGLGSCVVKLSLASVNAVWGFDKCVGVAGGHE